MTTERNIPVLYLVIPCYNEEAVLPETTKRLTEKMHTMIRAERFAGESKYPLKKMISFALDGITSFSVKPLKLISNLGILISVLSIFGLLYALISHLCGVTVAGWTAIVASIWLLGGLQMLCLGVVGGYIGKIYSEVKQRPRFLIETHLKAEPEEKVLDEH